MALGLVNASHCLGIRESQIPARPVRPDALPCLMPCRLCRLCGRQHSSAQHPHGMVPVASSLTWSSSYGPHWSFLVPQLPSTAGLWACSELGRVAHSLTLLLQASAGLVFPGIA